MELSPTDQSLVDALRQPVCLGGYDGFAPDPLHVQAADRIVELLSQLGTEKTMHAAWRKRAEEAEDERDEILERLKEIGDLVGCNHFNDPDGRLKLVNCVQDCLMSAESIAYVRRLTNQRNYSDPPVAKRPDGFPRRNDISLYCPAEAAIKAAVDAVEATGADVLLTDAVVLLGLAKDKVADFVELPR